MKFVFYPLVFLLLLVNCTESEENYHGKSAAELRKGKVYQKTYNHCLEKLKSGEVDDTYDLWVKTGEGSLGQLILASNYKYRVPSFPDYKDADWEETELAILDAHDFYLREKYGEDFWERLDQEVADLELKYKFTYYDTLLPQLVMSAYESKMVNDTLQIGIFNKKIFNDIPFYAQVDSFYLDYFEFIETEQEIRFKAIKKDWKDTTLYLLPAINLLIYWDSTKTDFPYTKYPISSVYLNTIAN